MNTESDLDDQDHGQDTDDGLAAIHPPEYDACPMCGDALDSGPTRHLIRFEDLAESSGTLADSTLCHRCWWLVFDVTTGTYDPASVQALADRMTGHLGGGDD